MNVAQIPSTIERRFDAARPSMQVGAATTIARCAAPSSTRSPRNMPTGGNAPSANARQAPPARAPSSAARGPNRATTSPAEAPSKMPQMPTEDTSQPASDGLAS